MESENNKSIIKIEHQNLLQSLYALLFKYQNEGKGHVFFDMSGHVGNGNIRVYVGEWEAHKEPEISLWLYREESILRAIEEIKYLHYNTPSVEERERQHTEFLASLERKQYERLKEKFEKPPTT